MKTSRGWFTMLLSVPFIGVDALLAWAFFGAGMSGTNREAAGQAIAFGVGLVAIAAVGLFGIVHFARRGSDSWSLATILGSVVAWFVLLAWVATRLQGVP